MGFQQGLSGLNAASKNLETIGNNVANANTVGFKASQAQFADVYANSLSGGGGSQIGIGTKVAAVVQQFTQGNISASSNPLDVAISGNGFFRMSNNGVITYSRNGQFQLDNQGHIVSNSGTRLTGYSANDNGILSTGAPTEISIRTSDLAPRTTSEVEFGINLDSRKPQLDPAAFDVSDPTTYSNSSSVSVFDSLGNEHVMQLYYINTTDPREWAVYGSMDGVTLPAASPLPAPTEIGRLVFTDEGGIDTAATSPGLLGQPPQLSINMDNLADALTDATGETVVNTAQPTFSFNLDFSSSTQFGAAFGVNKLTQDGFTAGRLAGFTIGEDGIISGRYTNGQTATLGQVVLANFANTNGLQPLGNNEWAETSTSGPALVGPPNSAGLGTLQANAVEDANVDLTEELVNMITAQRVYQANAQTIKTEDQLMQTLVNMR